MCGCITHRATGPDLVDSAYLMREPERTLCFSFAPALKAEAQYDRRGCTHTRRQSHVLRNCCDKQQCSCSSPDFQITKHRLAPGRSDATRKVQR
jgi:hypothetical protein